ncbi:plasmid pRiA4b ORF-3 family protein [Virgibacillus sp. L01]|uniref:plasmid pRiA4b ORF-3 family protein n=1 Tax=Virgibacillus sp. L01 TaxID=3457429 RepID=UPI003FD32D3A
MIYEFEITLDDVGVPVWRTIQMDSSSSFRDLHRVIQLAFDWRNMHLHSFFVDKTNGNETNRVEIGPQKADDEFPSPLDTYNEADALLSDWFKEVNDQVVYLYDFGDNWDHDVVLMKKLSSEQTGAYPRCIGAKNNAPEEDSRADVIMEEVNLINNNSQKMIDAINQDLLDIDENLNDFDELDDDFFNPESQDDPWEDVLLKAKEFNKLKPWEFMDDNQIFAVVDSVSGERLFCSVLGGAGEMFGLAVYPGEQGYSTLMDTLESDISDMDFILKQRSLLVSFEDRLDLEKEDYDLVKAYNVSFRGKKSWPEFRSFKPGYYPWFMDEDEGWIMLEALEQAVELCEEVRDGLELPDFYSEGKVLSIMPESGGNEIISLKADNKSKEVKLEVSELDLKRAKKLTNQIPATIEFAVTHLDIPVQEDHGGRPAFPVLVAAADHAQGIAFFQDLLYDSTDIGLQQSQLIKMLQLTEGIPEKIMMDKKTASIMEPLVKELHVNVEINEVLPNIQEIIKGIEDSI